MSFEKPTAEEEEKVRDLMNQLVASDISCFTETLCLRFLRDKQGKAADARDALEAHYRWRMENEVDNIDNMSILFQDEIEKVTLLSFSRYGTICSQASFSFLHVTIHVRSEKYLFTASTKQEGQ